MSDDTESAKEHELYEQRLEKAGRWRALGANPFGNGFRPADLAGDCQAALVGQPRVQQDHVGRASADVRHPLGPGPGDPDPMPRGGKRQPDLLRHQARVVVDEEQASHDSLACFD